MVGRASSVNQGDFTMKFQALMYSTVTALVVLVFSGCGVTVPDLVGKHTDEARTLLADAGLQVGAISQAESEEIPKDHVISHAPEAGKKVSKGSAVDLLVSRGSESLLIVPNLVGLSAGDADEAIIAAGFAPGFISLDCNDTVPSGHVISQNLVAGTLMDATIPISLVISTGECERPDTATAIVPDIIGKTQAQAQQAVASVGLYPGDVVQQCSDEVEAGKVIRQHPAPGTVINMGSPRPVDFVVSTGPCSDPQPETALVPNITGKTPEQAEQTLIAVGLLAGEVVYMCDATVAVGTIISQNLTAGVSVALGRSVAFVVSTGPCEDPQPETALIPNITGKTREAAEQELAIVGLVPGEVSEECDDLVEEGMIVSQNPAAGISVDLGYPVAFVVSTGSCPPTAVVPSLKGKTAEEAQALLQDLELHVGATRKAYSKDTAVGLITTHYPASGESVLLNTPVDIVLSEGFPLIERRTIFRPVREVEEIEIEPGVFVEAAKGELMVSLKLDVTQEELENILNFLEDQSFEVVGYSAVSRVLQVHKAHEDMALTPPVLEELLDHPHVLSVSPNMAVTLANFEVVYELPADRPLIIGDNWEGHQAELEDGYQPLPEALFEKLEADLINWQPQDFEGDWWIRAINAPEAWEISTGSPDVPIGIIESDILPKGTIDESRITELFSDGESGKGRGFYSPRSEHGEQITGLAASDGSGSGAVGVAWENPVFLVRWRWSEGGANRVGDIGSAIERCVDNNAKVINLSVSPVLGKSTVATENALLSQKRWWRESLTPFVNTAGRNDTLVVFAAGSDGYGITKTHHPRLVDDADNVLVEATRTGPGDGLYTFVPGTTIRNDDQLFPVNSKQSDAFWQTHALIVGAAAPEFMDESAGLFANEYTPTYTAQQYIFHPFTRGKIAQFSPLGEVVNLLAPGVEISHSPDFYPGSGTSFAAPLVSGSAALLKSINEDLSMTEVRRMLIDGANKAPLAGLSAKAGAGLLDLGRSATFTESSLAVPKHDTLEATLGLNQTKTFNVDVLVPDSDTKAVDIVFCIDVSASYYDDLPNIRSAAGEIVRELSSRISDLRIGVTSFSDFPVPKYGNPDRGDKAYFLNQPLTKNIDAFYSAINSLEVFSGWDNPESQLEALYQIATGAGRDINGNGDYHDVGDLLPKDIGWRPGAMRFIVLATDDAFHDSEKDPNYPGAGFSQTAYALKYNRITLLGLYTGDIAKMHMENLIMGVGYGRMFPLEGDSKDIVYALTSALDQAMSSVDVTIEVLDDHHGFVQDPESLLFRGVTPGDTVNFDLTLRGMLNKGISADEPDFEMMAWALVNHSGLVKRIPIKVTVPRE
jgi:beta-lactam-binding protein with PASTA domain/subtilisin family serine protease